MNENTYPKTIKEAVDRLLSEMHDRLKEEIANCNEKELIGKFNFGLGTHIRNAYGLWNYNNLDLLKNCMSENIHPDQASTIILKVLWKKLQVKKIIENIDMGNKDKRSDK